LSLFWTNSEIFLRPVLLLRLQWMDNRHFGVFQKNVV
jgi:hypothetical protein